MSEPTDFTEAGKIFEQSMKDALAHIDKVAADLAVQQEKAIDDQIAAKDELSNIRREAEKISAEAIEQHRKKYDENVRQDLLLHLTKNLIMAGRSVEDIFLWLEVKEDVILRAWSELGFTKLGDHVAHVIYDDMGKAGDVIFYRDDISLRFPYEFGAGLTLATVYVPTEEQWTAKTKLPVEDRMPILEFIAKRILRDQAKGHLYKIENDHIKIFLL